MERLTERNEDYTSCVNADDIIRLQEIENLMEQYNIPDLPTLETLLKANAEGRVVVLPVPIGSTVYDYSYGYPDPMSDIRVEVGYTQKGVMSSMPLSIFQNMLNDSKYICREAALEKEESDDN